MAVGLAQDMRRDARVRPQGAGLPGRGEVCGQERRDSIPAQGAASGVGEHGVCGATVAFLKPEPQGRGRFLPEGRAALLAAFAMATHVGSRTKHHVLAGSPDAFRDPQTRLYREP